MEKLLSPAEEREVLKAIREVEGQSSGEIRIYCARDLGPDPLATAQAIFSQLAMERTRLHNGVLLAFGLVDHQFSVYGDRGIAARVPADFWEQLRDAMAAEFTRGNLVGGIILAVQTVGGELTRHYPWTADDLNELPDAIVYEEA